MGASKGGGRRVRFALHEVAEYVVAAALVAVGFHVSGATQYLLVTVGGAMAVLGACTSGRLGAFDLLTPRAHHVGDLVLIGALALSPAVLYRPLHVAGIVLTELVALVLLRIERGTIYAEDPPRASSRSAGPAGADRAETSAQAGTAAPAGTDPDLVAVATTVAAVATAAATQLAPVAGRAARGGIRGAGVVAGAARRVARERSERLARESRPPGTT
jgi:hypothetical protein